MPVQVTGLTGVAQVAAGYDHSLALKSDGTVWAWGNNNHGQIGLPKDGMRVEVRVSSPEPAVGVFTIAGA
jgi:alpha-tubulin suppressor-like RCC1 family protein